MENFGKSQLLKFGWSEGKGLGKHENGMIEALQPKLKFDTAGIGHRDSNEYEWWKYIFDKAADNVDVNPVSHGISFRSKDQNLSIKGSQLTASNLKENLIYGNFIKTCTLEDGKIMANTEDAAVIIEEDKNKFETLFELDDEKLLAVCEGRTAHKGARHGMQLSGKLARIEKQERELMKKIEALELNDSWTRVKRKKKKKKYERERYKEEKVECDKDGDNNIVKKHKKHSEFCYENKLRGVTKSISKKSRLKASRRIDNLTHQLELFNLKCVDTKKLCKHKCKKYKGSEIDAESEKHSKDKSNSDSTGILFNDCSLPESEVNSSINKTIISEADMLNYRIMKKKLKKAERKKQISMICLSNNLYDLNSDEKLHKTKKHSKHNEITKIKIKKERSNKSANQE